MSEVTSVLTDRQRLSDFAIDWDLPKIHLRAHEVLVATDCVDEIAFVVIRHFTTRETARAIHFTKSSLIVRSWAQDCNGVWVEQDPEVIPDSDFVPYIKAHFQVPTAVETRAKLLYAAQCHRPGTKSYPMESFDLTAERSNEAPASMRKHWGI